MKFSFENLTFPVFIGISTNLCGLQFPTKNPQELAALQDLFRESYEYGLEHEIQGYCLCSGEEKKKSLPVGIIQVEDKFYLIRDENTAFLHHPACSLHEWKVKLGESA